jgi:hypothetical protein
MFRNKKYTRKKRGSVKDKKKSKKVSSKYLQVNPYYEDKYNEDDEDDEATILKKWYEKIKNEKQKGGVRKSLSNKDYKKILKFYKLSIPKTRKKIKKKARKILTKKYCSCLKKVKKKLKTNGREIGICTNSVINKKGIKRGKFTCKKKGSVDFYKGGKKNT